MMRKIVIEVICISFVLLFLYTAVSKIIDFSNFRAVIGQSPIVTRFAKPLSVAVPVVEIVISVLLVIPKYRLKALYASFALMILFTAYIIVLVIFSPKLPCSCGGVISMMTWDQHIYFNVFFCILAILGMILETKELQNTNTDISYVGEQSINIRK